MLTITEPSNYLAKIVQLSNPTKHPNADRLQLWDVGGYTIITDMSRKPGDICIYFPIECQIDSKIPSKMNLFSDKDLNEDKEQAGYVHKTGRVRAVKLRDIMSEGMVLPVSEVFKSLNFAPYKDHIRIGEEFDTIDGEIICKKYVPIIKDVRSGGGTGQKKVKINDFLLPGQFNFHYDTSKLQDNIHKFDNENDVIVITDKWHGTSAVFSNVLTKRKLSWWEKMRKFMGANIRLQEYSKMYSSRTVIKSIENKYNVPDGGYYNSDIWGKVFGEIKDKLFSGYTIYGEIVGYIGEKMIQKDYDYGCKPGEHKFLIYRITQTTSKGDVLEWSWDEIKDFCREHNLEHVKEFYHGKLKDWSRYAANRDVENYFLNQLKSVYLEQDCSYCTKKVPAEGICIRNESTERKTAFKLKGKKFLLRETAELDKENVEVVE